MDKEELTGRSRGQGGLFQPDGGESLDKRVVNLRLPTDLMDVFIEAANAEEVTKGVLVREIVTEWLKEWLELRARKNK